MELVPAGAAHPDGLAVLEFAEACGITLDDWQRHVLLTSLLRRDGRWAAFAVGVCAPRQNGKNGITEIRELAGPLVLGERLILHTAHLADTSKEAFRRLEEIIDANEWLSGEVRHVWRTNGHEAIEFRGGGRIRFRTRTTGGGRGFSGDVVVFDEPMFLPEISMGAILPVISARPDPQIWYTGSAVDQAVHEDGAVFARVRDRAVARSDPRLAYFEWSLDHDTPADVPELVAADPEMWAAANPALGIRIDPDYVAAERRELDPRTFAVERLGVGDWPSLNTRGGVINLDVWDGLEDRRSKVAGTPAFAFDVSPDRSHAAIAAAGSRDDGLDHVEVVEQGRGTGWIAARIADLAATHNASTVVCDASGPASSLIHDLEQAGVVVQPVSAKEHGQACGMLFDAVQQGRVRHLGTPELRAAVRGASTRPLGDAWAWSRKSSSIDISPLVACTLALWGARTAAAPFAASW